MEFLTKTGTPNGDFEINRRLFIASSVAGNLRMLDLQRKATSLVRLYGRGRRGWEKSIVHTANQTLIAIERREREHHEEINRVLDTVSDIMFGKKPEPYFKKRPLAKLISEAVRL